MSTAKGPQGITAKFIRKSINYELWTESNRALYKFCSKNPFHKSVPIVAAKLLLIGRSHAAAVERGAGGARVDTIYQHAAEKLCDSQIDKMLTKLREGKTLDDDLALEIHWLVTSCLPNKNDRKRCRRSLASKYLHFHQPNNFVKFDSRAKSAASKFIRAQRPWKAAVTCDHQYYVHTMKCEKIKTEVLAAFDIRLTNDQLDKLFLATAAKYKTK